MKLTHKREKKDFFRSLPTCSIKRIYINENVESNSNVALLRWFIRSTFQSLGLYQEH